MKPTAHYSATQDLKALSVLIVDDDKSFLRLLTSVLQSLGHCVIASENKSKLATELAISHRPDIAIVGAGAPPWNGILTAQSVLRHYDVPIIICLDQADAETLSKITETNILSCLVKPFSPAQLVSNICMAMAQHNGLHATELDRPAAEISDTVATNTSTKNPTFSAGY